MRYGGPCVTSIHFSPRPRVLLLFVFVSPSLLSTPQLTSLLSAPCFPPKLHPTLSINTMFNFSHRSKKGKRHARVLPLFSRRKGARRRTGRAAMQVHVELTTVCLSSSLSSLTPSQMLLLYRVSPPPAPSPPRLPQPQRPLADLTTTTLAPFMKGSYCVHKTTKAGQLRLPALSFERFQSHVSFPYAGRLSP